MDVKSLIDFAEEQDFEELHLPVSAFVDLEKSVGWQAIVRICASWISVRRDELETTLIVTEEDRVALARVQGAIEILRSVIQLPDVLEVDTAMEKEETEDEPSK